MAKTATTQQLVELREIEYLTTSMAKSMDELALKDERRFELLKEHGSQFQKMISDIQDTEDLAERINQLQKKENSLTYENWGLNKDVQNQLLNQVKSAKEALAIELRRRNITDTLVKKAEDFGEAMTQQLGNLKSSLAEIPVIGKVLNNIIPYDTITKQIGKVTTAFTDKFTDAFAKNLAANKGFTSSFASGMTEGLGAAGEAVGPLLTNPYTAAALAILAVTAIGVIGLYKLASATKQFRQETGLLNSETKGLEKQIQATYIATAPLGASMDDAVKAAVEFTKVLAPSEMISGEVMTNMVALNKNFGVSYETAAQLNKVFQNIGGMTQQGAQSMIDMTVSMAQTAKLAPQKVLQDMADSAEYAYKYFNGNPKALAAAAIQAAKLGTSIKQAGEVADGLLDFQTSITNELSASAILGTNLNLSQARYLAANRDATGAQQATLDAVAAIGDITHLNIQEQQALTDATHIQYSDLVNQMRIRDRMTGKSKEELSAALDLLQAGEDVTKMTDEQLAKKTKEIILQKEMQSEFDNMANKISSQFSSIMMALVPMGTLLMNILSPILDLVVGFFRPIGKALSRVMDAVQKLMVPFKDLFGKGAGMASVFELIGNILSFTITNAIEFAAATISAIGDIIGGIYKIIKGIFTLDFGLIMEGLGQGLRGIGEWFLRLPITLFNAFVDMFPTLGGYISDFFSSIGSKIKAFFMDILPDWAKRFVGGVSGDDSLAASQKTQAETPPADASVNDGVIQNGKVISTNPSDTIFATKNPDGLLSGLGGILDGISGAAGNALGSVNGSNRIIEKLDELIAATAGSRDVYMDKEKVTNVVATTNEKSGKNRFGLMGA
jgi:hypothetical protein